MGSYNIACGLSGLPITEGDRVAFIPMSRSKFKARDVGPTYTDPCQFFAPVLPPVFGTYDSYGRMDNIEPSATTALIERVMNRSIETALRSFTDGRTLYDSHGKTYETYVTNPGRLGEYDATVASILMSLGFEAVGEEDSREFFHPNSGAIILQGGYAHHVRDRRGRLTYLEDSSIKEILSAFGNATGVYPGVAPEDQDAAHLTSKTTGMFVHPDILTGMAETISDDVIYRRAGDTVSEHWDNLQGRFARTDPSHPEHDKFSVFASAWSDNELVDAMRRGTAWEPAQYEYLRHLDQASVLAMMQVKDVANALGSTLGPTQVLSEVDSLEYALAAHRIAGSILKRQTLQWDHDAADWE